MNTLFLLPITTGPVFIIAGFIMLKFPPKNINGIYGYRTPGSKKSQERWDFAQNFAAKELIKIGSVLTITCFTGLMYKPDENMATIIATAITLVMVAVLIFRVEFAIKRKFG